MNKALSALLLFCLSCTLLHAQQQRTDIWLLDMIQKDGKTEVLNPYRVTDNDHYDNQPSFSRDGKFLYWAAMPDTTQSDLYEFDIRKKVKRQITNTAESEYQPQPIPYDKGKLSYVRVEMEKAQKLYFISIDGSGEDFLMPNEDSVAYYCWINDTTVGAYMLNGSGGTLHQFDMIPQQSIILMQGGFGRCLSKIPGTNLFTYVVYGKEKHTLMKYDMATEERLPIVELPEGVEDYCWGPDGKIYVGKEGKLYVCQPKEEELAEWNLVADLSETIGNFYRIAISPGGEKMALVSFKGSKP
jgi:hypothetical protein